MGDGLYLQRRRQREGSPMNPQHQQARRTVAEELRASLRRHEQDVSAGLEGAAQAMNARIEAAVQDVECRAAIFRRGFWGRLNWLLTGR